MKADVVAYQGVGANADVIDTDQFDKVVVVVEHAVDVLCGSSLSELGSAVTQHSPPFAAQGSSSSSERERRVGRMVDAALWLKTTGTCESSMVSSAVREPACDRSIAMPMSFMRFTTSTPNSLKPQFVRSNWPSPIQLLRVYVRPARRMPMPYSTSTRCSSWSIDRCSTVGRNPTLPDCRASRMSCVRPIFITESPRLWTSASIIPISSTRSPKRLNDASGSLPRQESRLAVATAVQPPALTASKPQA